MNGIHDMGGMHGFGPIYIEQNEPVFHEEWEGRVYGLNRVLGQWGRGQNWAGFRFTLESIPPAEYLRMSYYERWYEMWEGRMLQSGYVTPEELADGQADPDAPAPQLPPAPASSGPGFGLLDMDINPAFAAGEEVRVREHNNRGHNRLPRYTRDKTGVIHSDNGIYNLQDTDENGQSLGEFPQHVYTVKFSARELWGDDGHPRDSVYVDIWESYLE